MEAPVKPAPRRPPADPKGYARSRVTNGGELLPGIDGRSIWVRRCRDLIELHLADIGGEENASVAERSIIRRAAVMMVELERIEKRFAASERGPSQADLDLYVRAAGNLRRLLESIGIKRRARDVTPLPSVDEYLAAEAAP
jgi:hypothetical protein